MTEGSDETKEPAPPETREARPISDPDKRALAAGLALAFKAQRFRGPLPHPDVLAGYDRVQAGLAERVVRMAEKEQDHRHALDDKFVDAEVKFGSRGQVFVLIVALAFLAAALVLGLAGQTAAAVAVTGIDLAAVVAPFLWRKTRTPAN
jgi:uncharacterized membrane protein